MTPSPAVPTFLRADLGWILFGGKGGVGKTTCAAATALYRARREAEDVLLLSTDPAHSLRDSLGDEPIGRLTVQEFDAEAALQTFREAHRTTLHDIVARGTLFDDEDIGRLLDLGLPGLDETMAVLYLARRLDDAAADTVVIDTAPTGHTLRLLDTPALFETWLGVLDVMLDKHRTLKAAFAGHDEPDALDTFLDDLTGQVQRVREALRAPSWCRFVPVTQPEPLVLAETERLGAALDRRGVPSREIVINRCPRSDDGPARADAAPPELGSYPALFENREGWALPSYDGEVVGADRLQHLWEDARRLRIDLEAWSDGDDDRAAPAVLRSLPSPPYRFVLFAGKGGVGKTTMAGATALHWADAHPDDATLLLSTDPAHSLGTALDQPVGDEPTAVVPGLDAVEVDATARFDALRDDYVREVRQFFRRTTGPQVDLTHDRAVAERLLDLSPPGVDEIMGWTAAMEALDGPYDRCVLDAAPTGHFVRMLEMPRLFEEWLGAFFRILRKYRSVLRLPTLSDRLVQLSKQTKSVRRLLEEDGGGAVYGVTQPGAVVRAETQDLVEHVDRLGVECPALILNRVPTSGTGAEAVLDPFQPAFPARRIAAVTEGRPPVGTEALQDLGDRLYS